MTSITRPSTDATLPRTPGVPGLAGLVRGRAEDAAWVQPAFLGVTVLAAILYVVNLTVSGFANTYYSAAALAASQSWSAWFFGSFDAANFITVDKPPLATMLMGLSVRIFGLSSWSVLLPEALAGVLSVALLFVIVRRSYGPAAAVVASLVMALTPAAVLIFRYNNPDALLTLLLVGAAGAFLRSLEKGRVRWVVLASLLVGLAFNTKLLQAYLVLPSFAITYLIAAPGAVWRRLGILGIALVTVLVSSSWWVLVTVLLPASAHPFIGGSTNNSALDLIFGYNGLARIFGNTFGGGGPGGGGPGGGFAGGPGGGAGFSGTPGLFRLFNSELGGQVAWLLPFSVVGLASGLALRWRAARTDPRRAATLMWGLWLVVTAATFSFMSGIIHSYYTVALAPAIGALVGIGVVELWSWRRRSIAGGLVLGATILGSGVVAWQLLERTPSFAPGLGLIVLGVSAVVALIVAIPHDEHQRHTQMAAVALGLAVLLAGPTTYAVDTMLTAHSGGDPAAGPSAGNFGRGGGGPGAASTDAALVQYLLANQDGATWIVATTSAQEAGSIELAAGAPVMAMGGFSGSDPAPTLDEFKALVAAGKIRYVLVSGRGGFGGPGGGSSSVSAIDTWAASVGTPVSYGGSATLYDLSSLVTGA